MTRLRSDYSGAIAKIFQGVAALPPDSAKEKFIFPKNNRCYMDWTSEILPNQKAKNIDFDLKGSFTKSIENLTPGNAIFYFEEMRTEWLEPKKLPLLSAERFQVQLCDGKLCWRTKEEQDGRVIPDGEYLFVLTDKKEMLMAPEKLMINEEKGLKIVVKYSSLAQCRPVVAIGKVIIFNSVFYSLANDMGNRHYIEMMTDLRECCSRAVKRAGLALCTRRHSFL